MKRSKIIAILCVVMLSALALALLASCDTTGNQYHYDYLVTFDYNVDNLKDDSGNPLKTNCETEYLGVEANSKIAAPGKFGNVPGFKEFEVTGYSIEGWYTAELDAEGNPVKDANENIVLKTKWNFDTDTVSANITLYANFVKNLQFKVMLGANDYIVIDGQSGMTVDEILVTTKLKDLNDWTYLGEIYVDEEFTQKLTFPYPLTDTDFTCYAKVLQGKWTIVEDTKGFLNALSLGANMYVNAKELDFTEEKFAAPNTPTTYFGKEYWGKIQGNGCVIKNLNFALDCQRNVTSKYAFFQTLGSTAEISGLTFQNVNITVNVNQLTTYEFKTAFFAVTIEEGAKLNNVTFSGCSLTLAGAANTILENIEQTLNNNGYYFEGSSYDCFKADELTVTNNIIQQ